MASKEQLSAKNTNRCIAGIKAARKRGKCLVSFTNDEYVLLERDLIFEFSLQKGQILNDDLYSSIVTKEQLINAKKAGLSYATYALRSTLQVRNRLKEKGYSHDIIEDVISFLKEFNYLSDEFFTEQFIRAKINRKHYGYQRIRRELGAKGIHSNIIESMLEKLYPDTVAYETARKSAEKKLRSIAFRDAEKKKVQLYNHLRRQGFPTQIIKTIISEYC